MVRIRLSRHGRRNRPFFRINAIESRTKRDGKVLEQLGWYNPLEKDAGKAINLNEERVKFWLANGAMPSDTMMDMLAKRNLVDAAKWAAVREKRKNARLAAPPKADPKKK